MIASRVPVQGYSQNDTGNTDSYGKSRYNQEITPQPPPQASPEKTIALVIFWLTLVLAVAGTVGAWSNHFQNDFHADDTATIVSNPAIRTLSNIPKFFVNPALSSTKIAQAVYEPLVYTVFALDYALPVPFGAGVFQFQNFVWLGAVMGMIYLVFWLIPGGNHYSALFAAVLFGLHPLAADTFNEPLRLDMAMGIFGLLGGLAIALVWPGRMPAVIDVGAPRVPKTDRDLFLMKLQPKVTHWYQLMRRRSLGLYLLPVGFGLLAFPNTAVFALILFAYMLIFEPGKNLGMRRYAMIACGGYWLVQTILILRSLGHTRVPLLDFWVTQPLVIVRAFFFFFVPFHMEGISTLQPVEQIWSPWAIVGFVGTAALVWLAAQLSRSAEWRAVGFGLWWFLIALLPTSLAPQTQVEAWPNALFASVGLALALSRTLLILGERLGRAGFPEMVVPGLGLALGLTVLSVLGYQTWTMNDVWRTDESIWTDAIQKFPEDGIALTRYATIVLQSTETDFFGLHLSEAYSYLKKATALMPRNADALIQLAQASERKLLDDDAGAQLRAAIQINPSYAAPHGWYARWLLDRGKIKEATAEAQKAVELDPSNSVGWQAIADIHLANSDWQGAIDAGNRVLKLDPDSEDGRRSLLVAEAGLSSRKNAETTAAKTPSVDAYLTLSSAYFNEKRYEDSIKASKEALKLQPDTGEAWVNIAAAYHELGKHEEAIAALREAARLRPDFEFVKSNLEWELAHQNDNPSSEQH